jgi:hypothetical protein
MYIVKVSIKSEGDVVKVSIKSQHFAVNDSI